MENGIEVVALQDWPVGGRTYQRGEKLWIRPSMLEGHVAAGRCVLVKDWKPDVPAAETDFVKGKNAAKE